MSIVAKKIMMGSGAVALPSDSEFNRTSFLSHFDGTNNGVNNQFTDGSASNHTITANGNVTQGSFNPYGTNWGVDFGAGGFGANIASNSEFAIGSSSNFTFEYFLFWGNNTDNQVILDARPNDTNGAYSVIIVYGASHASANKVNFILTTDPDVKAVSSSTLTIGAWNHVVCQRTSGTLEIYINGTKDSTTTSTTGSTTANRFLIGANAFDPQGGSVQLNRLKNGNILSNIRFVNGTAVYSGSSITVPTSALTAITNTKFLALQSNRFVDNSTLNNTITTTSNMSVTAFGPILTSSVYDPAVNGASAYFDGTGDYLTVASSSDFDFGTSDFCWECWVFQTSRSAFQLIMAQDDYSSGNSISCWLTNTGQASIYYEGGGTHFTTTATVPLNTWTHLAWVRKGTGTNEFSIYINGTAEVSGTMTTSFDQDGIIIGQQANGSYDFNGYVSNIRIANGSHIYTSNFTPPTAPLTAVTNTKLLLNMADGQAIDSAAQNNLTLYGNAKLSTGQAKFGDTSLLLDGTGDYAYIPETENFTFGTGDFTIEFWYYGDATQNDYLFDMRVSADNEARASVYFNSGNRLSYYTSNTTRITSNTALSTSTWTHIALVRSSAVTRFYFNGTQDNQSFSDTLDMPSAQLVIGGKYTDDSQRVTGYFDDFRISRMARYTSNFTAPTEQFADKGQ